MFRGRTHWNHNRLLNEYEGADGIKTGYVNDSGFNLVASAQRDGVRLVAAVFGGRTGRERDRHMMTILDRGFAAMGVAPRDNDHDDDDAPVIARGRRASPGLLARVARAATVRWRPGTFGRQRPQPPPRLPALKLASTSRVAAALPARHPKASPPAAVLRRSVRLEQGDTGGRSAVTASAARTARGTSAPAAAHTPRR